MDTISEYGYVSDKGNLLLPMDRINEFIAKHPGKRIIATFDAITPEATELQKVYYYKYVLPCVTKALRNQGYWMTDEKADEFLLSQYPGKKPDNTRQFDTNEMYSFLEWLKQYAAENLYVYVEDPRTL